jgi:hypothetical protein
MKRGSDPRGARLWWPEGGDSRSPVPCHPLLGRRGSRQPGPSPGPPWPRPRQAPPPRSVPPHAVAPPIPHRLAPPPRSAPPRRLGPSPPLADSEQEARGGFADAAFGKVWRGQGARVGIGPRRSAARPAHGPRSTSAPWAAAQAGGLPRPSAGSGLRCSGLGGGAGGAASCICMSGAAAAPLCPRSGRRRDGAGGGDPGAAGGAEGGLSAWSGAGQGPRRRGAGPGRAEVSGVGGACGAGAAPGSSARGQVRDGGGGQVRQVRAARCGSVPRVPPPTPDQLRCPRPNWGSGARPPTCPHLPRVRRGLGTVGLRGCWGPPTPLLSLCWGVIKGCVSGLRGPPCAEEADRALTPTCSCGARRSHLHGSPLGAHCRAHHQR